MEFYPATLSSDESNELADKISAKIHANGWGFWAVELKISSQFIGFVGLNNPTYQLPVTSCTEIGWRLAKPYWGMGYATEAGQAALDFGFSQLNLSTIHAFASAANIRSIRVMHRLGMTNTEQNFEHPLIPEHHPLREHVLYKINNPGA